MSFENMIVLTLEFCPTFYVSLLLLWSLLPYHVGNCYSCIQKLCQLKQHGFFFLFYFSFSSSAFFFLFSGQLLRFTACLPCLYININKIFYESFEPFLKRLLLLLSCFSNETKNPNTGPDLPSFISRRPVTFAGRSLSIARHGENTQWGAGFRCFSLCLWPTEEALKIISSSHRVDLLGQKIDF